MIPPFVFVAEYDDGQIYHQDPRDVSRQNPLKSAFYDICQAPLIPEERLVKFGLVRTRIPTFVAVVDLRTGAFTINGQPVGLPPDAPTREGVPLRLVYGKRNELHLQSGTHKITYRIGWQHEDTWVALDFDTNPDKITLRGSHERNSRPELAATVIG